MERVRNTLKFGMWMVDEKPLEKGARQELSTSRSKHDGRGYDNKEVYVARTCFTELKLSEARKHAYEYGRLGFGIKRTYLFRRAGLPMIYFNNKVGFTGHPNWISDAILKSDFAPAYLKHMSEKEDLNYKYYSESEWRIICPNVDNFTLRHDEDHLEQKVLDKVKDLIVDINGNLDEEVKKYGNGVSKGELEKFKEELEKQAIIKKTGLRYLLPFDFELAVIIYPSPKIKILAERDDEIRKLIKNTRYWRRKEEKGMEIDKFYNYDSDYEGFLKQSGERKIKMVEVLKKRLEGTGERMMSPMEIDLDTISHF